MTTGANSHMPDVCDVCGVCGALSLLLFASPSIDFANAISSIVGEPSLYGSVVIGVSSIFMQFSTRLRVFKRRLLR